MPCQRILQKCADDRRDPGRPGFNSRHGKGFLRCSGNLVSTGNLAEYGILTRTGESHAISMLPCIFSIIIQGNSVVVSL